MISKEMLYPREEDYHNEDGDEHTGTFDYFVDQHGTICQLKTTTNGTCEVDHIDGIWMQFTGKKDKYDKEIYEDDIGNIAGRSLSVCEWDNENPSFAWWEYENGKKVRAGQMLMDDTENDHVIGNIHENPELI